MGLLDGHQQTRQWYWASDIVIPDGYGSDHPGSEEAHTGNLHQGTDLHILPMMGTGSAMDHSPNGSLMHMAGTLGALN